MNRLSLTLALRLTVVTGILAVLPVSAQSIYLSNDYPSPTVTTFGLDGSSSLVTSDFSSDTTIRALAFDNSGALYVIDGNNVDKISSTGSVSTYATLSVPSGSTPIDMAFDSSNNLYVSIASTAGGSGTVEKVASGGGTGTLLPVTLAANASGIAIDHSGNIYVASGKYSSLAVIYKMNSDGTGLTDFATTGLTGPGYLAFDASGNLYASEQDGSISMITPEGVVSTYFSSGDVNANLLAFDPTGDLFTTTFGGVAEIAPGGGDDYTLIPNSLTFPQGMAIGAAVPEPSNWGFGGAAVLALLWLRIRRNYSR